MRRIAVLVSAIALLIGCGMPAGNELTGTSTTVEDSASTTADVAPSATSTVPGTSTSTTSTTTPMPSTTTTIPPSTTTVPVGGGRWSLQELGVEPGIPIEQPDDMQTLPPPPDSFSFQPPYERARISSRLEINEDAFDQPIEGDGGYTITYIPGFTIWDITDGSREVRVHGGDFMTLNPDGSWEASDHVEWAPIGPLVEWRDAQSGYEGFHSAGFTVESYERIAGVDTAQIRWQDAPSDMWADIWVDSNGVVMRVVADFGLEDPEFGDNRWWLIWDVETLDPQDIGPLPPSP